MNQAQEARARRNYVSNMYPYPGWHEKVATMPADQVLAIYLRFIRDGQKPKPELPEELKPDIQEDQDDDPEQFQLF